MRTTGTFIERTSRTFQDFVILFSTIFVPSFLISFVRHFSILLGTFLKTAKRSLDEMIPRSRVCGESSEQFGYLEEDMHQLNGDGDSCIYKIKGTFLFVATKVSFGSYHKSLMASLKYAYKNDNSS